MPRAAVIGAQPQVGGFALAGVRVHAAATAEEVRAAWRALPAEIAVVFLTAAAADALGPERDGGRLTVVIPP